MMNQKYQLIVEGPRTVKVTIYTNSYDKAQQRAVEVAIEYFPETSAKDWEVIETITVKKARRNRHY